MARYVPGRVKVYPDSDTVQEFGSERSLVKYGIVVVSGRPPTNGVLKVTLRGERFARGEEQGVAA